ncbi:MAG: hypothetical protein JWN75_1170 [Candidatus Saccharibacteria bacterium]|nr:hypothetical protein [Candidatus Saccharibacteria bacterium]
MTETIALAKFFQEYGPWAFVALLTFALRWVVVKYDAAQEARIKDGKEMGGLLASTNDALRKTHSLIEGHNARMALMIPAYRAKITGETTE